MDITLLAYATAFLEASRIRILVEATAFMDASISRSWPKQRLYYFLLVSPALRNLPLCLKLWTCLKKLRLRLYWRLLEWRPPLSWMLQSFLSWSIPRLSCCIENLETGGFDGFVTNMDETFLRRRRLYCCNRRCSYRIKRLL
ncbi:hypothetical protein Tsp_15708 [Trichinella spiralis]|uniref:hypothetical protein n=1 Tax=Trichinella spiralis TaxID=6334 RepID=UPI0001EFEFFA|nr:hypothetical protein Tsp_15708 [Trichinella spiralis]